MLLLISKSRLRSELYIMQNIKCKLHSVPTCRARLGLRKGLRIIFAMFLLPTVYKLCSRKVSPHCSVNSVPKSSASLATMAETTGWPSCCETAQLATFPGDPCKYHQLLPATVTLVNYHSHPDLTAGQAPQSLRYQGLGDTRRQPSKQTSPDGRLII